MTREEEIEHVFDDWYIENGRLCVDESNRDDFCKALGVGIKALRPVSREQVEQVWRSYWDGFSNGYADGYEVYDEWQCRKCGFEVETDGPETLPQFCPSCGAPMTGEAVDILLKRLEAQKDELSRLQAP